MNKNSAIATTKLREKDGFKTFSFIMALATIAVMWVSFEFKDFDSITAWSLNIWDLIFSKDLGLKDFYPYTAQNLHGVLHQYCQGNYVWLFPLSVWNFPLWLIVNLFDVSVVIGNPWCMIWSKLYFIGLHLALAHVAYLICNKLGVKSCLAPLLILVAPEILISAEFAGQDEITYIFCVLLAIYFAMCDKWKLSYLCCVLAVSFCPIMLLPATAIILYKEKKVVRVVLYEIGLLVPLMLFEVAYINDEIYQIMKRVYSIGPFVEQLFPISNVNSAMGAVPISIILIIFVLFFAYTRKTYEGKELLYIVTLVMVIISFGMDHYFYRTLIHVPFLIIVVVLNQSMRNMNMFLMMLLMVSRASWNLTVGVENVFNTCYILRNSWMTKICDYFGSDRYTYYTCRNLLSYMEKVIPTWVYWVVVAVAYACVGLLLYCNYYKKEKTYEFDLNYKWSITVCLFIMPVIIGAFWMILI